MIPCHPPTLLFKIEGARPDKIRPVQLLWGNDQDVNWNRNASSESAVVVEENLNDTKNSEFSAKRTCVVSAIAVN
jgi:hypothetical protein